jgi:hypothetical protein
MIPAQMVSLQQGPPEEVRWNLRDTGTCVALLVVALLFSGADRILDRLIVPLAVS